MERHRSEYGGPWDPDCPSRGVEATLAPPPPMVEGDRMLEKSTGIQSLCDGLDSASGDDLCYEVEMHRTCPLQCSAEAEYFGPQAERVPKFGRTSAEYFFSTTNDE